MPYLANQKWELACSEAVNLTLAGEPKARLKAYENAGLGVKGSRSNASNARRFFNRPIIKARFHEVFHVACAYREITAARLVVRIDRVGGVNIADFYEADGRTVKNIKTLPRELTDAVESIEYVADGKDDSGQTRYLAKVKLFDKNAANFTLLKHFGGLPEPAPAPVAANNIFNVLSTDDQAILLEMLEALGRGQGAADQADQIEHRK